MADAGDSALRGPISRAQLIEIESAAVRAWPALETADIDGWLWRYASGGSLRANSVSTLSFREERGAARTWHHRQGCERCQGACKEDWGNTLPAYPPQVSRKAEGRKARPEIPWLIITARKLARASPMKPRQAELRRSVSTAYYALFHALAENAADLLVGVGQSRGNEAWVRRLLRDQGLRYEGCGRKE